MTSTLDIYFWPTPNGHKITIAAEEMGLPYRLCPVNIGAGDQFKPEFLAISPNNRMPALVDPDGPDGAPIAVFESGAILLYLARKTGRFYGEDERSRVKVEEWLMWQMAGLGPMSGQASHFRLYAPTIEPDETKTAYGRERYTNEVNRLYGVMDRQLAQTPFLAGAYSIADMASWPWVRGSKLFGQNLDDFPHLKRWFDEIGAREAVKRGGGAGQELRQATNAATTPGARSMLFGQTAQSIQEEADKAKR